MAIASLQVTKTYADGLAWTEARMDTAMQSIQTYTKNSLVNNFNQVIADAFSATYSLDNDGAANYSTPVRSMVVTASLNLQQVRKDGWGTAYTLDGDGNANRTNTLYNKQSAVASYNTTIELNTTAGAWTLTSASLNLRLAPEATGKYIVSYNFSPLLITSDDPIQARIWYGIFNKTAGATLIAQRMTIQDCNFPTDETGVGEIQRTILLNYIHNFASTAAATFALYYRVSQITNVANHQLYCSATGKCGIYAQIHKI